MQKFAQKVGAAVTEQELLRAVKDLTTQEPLKGPNFVQIKQRLEQVKMVGKNGLFMTDVSRPRDAAVKAGYLEHLTFDGHHEYRLTVDGMLRLDSFEAEALCQADVADAWPLGKSAQVAPEAVAA